MEYKFLNKIEYPKDLKKYKVSDLKKIAIELRNKTCGILGMGGIGFCVAERLKSFGMKIIGISEDLIPLVTFVDEFYTSEQLLEVLPRF